MANFLPLSNGSKYANIHLRGEGRQNFVVGATRDDGVRIVWRFRKDRKTRILNVASDAENSRNYIRSSIAPLLSRTYVTVPLLVSFSQEDLKQLMKIPQLREYFPPSILVSSESVLALEMPDFTYLPVSGSYLTSTVTANGYLPGETPTIAIEIKPKQGFLTPSFSPTPAPLLTPYCNNCLLQLDKCHQGSYQEMYAFCPLDLFSGNEFRVRKAIRSLIRVPHHNLRIFSNGRLVHSEDFRLAERSEDHSSQSGLLQLNEADLESCFFPETDGCLDDVVEAVSRILTGSVDDNAQFRLQKDSVLERILSAQMLDTVGVLNAYDLYKSLPDEIVTELKDPYRLFETSKKQLASDSESLDALKLLKGYLASATIKDCSVIVTMKQVPSPSFSPPIPFPSSLNVLRLSSGINFVYNVAVIDLDVKSLKKLETNRQRLLDAIAFVRSYAGNFDALRHSCCCSSPSGPTV